ncbi:MAG: NAD-dependent epimerase/dehydratase family protein [Actinomycetota bacterium]|nr:NAD-dependent epimerase/dehydratase family protein [Actinomycetota bacterium]
MKVVVTGGAGFIGANLCRELACVHPSTDIVVVDDVSTGHWSNLTGVDVDRREGSILDPSLLSSACSGADAIVHLAARGSVPRSLADPVATHEVNVTGTVRVLEAARGNGSCQVVMASSSSVYGANPALPKSEDLACRPMNPYAASKLAAESYALGYQHSYGLPVLAFRFFNVFGPMQPAGHTYAAVIPSFVSAALAGRPLQIFGDGKQSRDFTYVGSVVKALVVAVSGRMVSPTPVNLAFGTQRNLLEVVSALESLLGHPVAVDHVAPRNADVTHSSAEPGALRALLPDIAPWDFMDGLAKTVEWFRSIES